MTSTNAKTVARRRGRPAAASRGDVLELALSRYLHCKRVDVQAIAAELCFSHTTINQIYTLSLRVAVEMLYH